MGFASHKGPSSHSCRCKNWIMSCALQLYPWCQASACLVFPFPSAFAFCKHGDFMHPGEDRGLQWCPVPSAPSWSWKRAYLSHFSSASAVAFPLLSQVSLLIAHINLTEKDCSFHPALKTCLICLGNRTFGTFQIGKTLIYSPTCNTTHFCIHRAQNTFSCVVAEKYFGPYDNLVSQTGQLLLFSS